MPDTWVIHGVEYSNCNCDYGCPCQFNAPSTYGSCEALGSLQIDEGHYKDVSLSGLKCVFIYQWPGEIAEGNGRHLLIVDENASDEQRDALIKITRGESTTPGATHFYIFSSTLSEVLPPLFLPIELEIDIDARRAHVKIEDMLESSGSPIIDPFSKEEMRAGIHLPGGFEYTYAEMGSGTSSVKGPIPLEFKDSYGQFSELHMNQDGVIR